MKKRCKILAIEGPDSSGKGAQSSLVAEALRDKGAKVALVKAPFVEASWTHSLIRKMLKNGWAKRVPHVFQFFQFLNRMSFQLRVLPRLMKDNNVIVSDRWVLSSIVYGDATGVNKTFTRVLAWFYRRPDRTIVLTGRSYARKNVVDDAYDRDVELQKRVDEGYKAWTWDHLDDHFFVDNHRNIKDVHRTIMTIVQPPCPICGAQFGEHCDAGLHS